MNGQETDIHVWVEREGVRSGRCEIAIELGKIAVLSIPLLKLTRDFCIIRRDAPLSKDPSEVLAAVKATMR